MLIGHFMLTIYILNINRNAEFKEYCHEVCLAGFHGPDVFSCWAKPAQSCCAGRVRNAATSALRSVLLLSVARCPFNRTRLDIPQHAHPQV